ncbi:hypothetical protein V493_00257 [Pseudogymnoascus sp. VKM F-4281 (FW-2241)]|nr:hypothetical protein V493_00257 [Pseudogymnoascus sp. VKM F-4281 (FW-2241)]
MKIASIALAGVLFATVSSEYIYGFEGCTADQKKTITTSWKDAVKLAKYSYDQIYQTADHELDYRYFNDFPTDMHGERLKYLPRPSGTPVGFQGGTGLGGECSNTPQSGKIGAYALSENGSVIVLCEPFFQVPSLAMVKANLDGPLKDRRKDLRWMKNQGAVFLHEMTHLFIIGHGNRGEWGKYNFDILDYNLVPGDEIAHKVYGPKLCERFALKQKEYAGRNADNYAWYATARWFSQYYGKPDKVYTAGDVDGEAQLPTADDGPSMDVFDEIGDLTVGELKGTVDPKLSRDDIEEMLQWVIAEGREKKVPDIIEELSGKKLRILALGDSITNGYKSSNNQGYRGPLATLLAGNTVSIINEGHNGAVISEIANFAKNSLPNRPNVILLHAGTNDMVAGADVTGPAARLGSLIDQISAACPDASILVSLIIRASDVQSRVDTYNTLVKKVLTDRAQNGKHVDLVDMTKVLGAGDMADGLHPNDSGYAKMAQAWLESIKRANTFGWVKDPVNGGGSKNSCPKNPNWIPQTYIASGGDNGSALPAKTTCKMPVCTENSYANLTACIDNCSSGMCTETAGNPDVVCDGCAEEPTEIEPTYCNCRSASGKRSVVNNPLGGPCSALGTTGHNAVKFADIDGDGRDDYLWVGTDGKVLFYRNIGLAPDEGPNAGKIQYEPHGVIATGVGATGDQIRFADLDGDGRAEYIWVHDNGAVTVWWNGGFDQNSNPKVNWFPGSGEVVASGIGDGQGVRFADINGDGKADFIHLAKDGAMTLYMNLGRQGTKWGWWNWGVQAAGVGAARSYVRFADLNGDGRADYVTLKADTGEVYAWTNNGVANGDWASVSKIIWHNRKGDKPIASGMSYLDSWSDGTMIGFGDLNKDGRDELLYVGVEDSSVYAYLNGC